MEKKTEEVMVHMEERIGHKIEENMQRHVKLIQNLEEKFPKCDCLDQGTQEDKDSIHVEQPSINKNSPRDFNSNNGSN